MKSCPVGAGVAVAVGVPPGVGNTLGAGVALGIGVALAPGVAEPVGVAEAVGVALGVGVGLPPIGVAVGVAVGVGVGVGVGVCANPTRAQQDKQMKATIRNCFRALRMAPKDNYVMDSIKPYWAQSHHGKGDQSADDDHDR